jgi:hypothetical protein
MPKEKEKRKRTMVLLLTSKVFYPFKRLDLNFLLKEKEKEKKRKEAIYVLSTVQKCVYFFCTYPYSFSSQSRPSS